MKKHRQINKTLVPQRKKGTKTRFLRKVTGEGRRGRGVDKARRRRGAAQDEQLRIGKLDSESNEPIH